MKWKLIFSHWVFTVVQIKPFKRHKIWFSLILIKNSFFYFFILHRVLLFIYLFYFVALKYFLMSNVFVVIFFPSLRMNWFFSAIHLISNSDRRPRRFFRLSFQKFFFFIIYAIDASSIIRPSTKSNEWDESKTKTKKTLASQTSHAETMEPKQFFFYCVRQSCEFKTIP